jgi:hypothetical protein
MSMEQVAALDVSAHSTGRRRREQTLVVMKLTV